MIEALGRPMWPMLQRIAAPPRKHLLAGLGGLVVLLGLVNIYLASSSVDTSPLAAPRSSIAGPGQPGKDRLTTPLDGKAPGSFAETGTRPIFNANRKPTERQQPQGALLAGPDDLRLMGILQTAAGVKRALIRAGADAKGVWVVEGEAISGWTLKSIGQRSVIVVNGGRNYEVMINKAPGR